MNLRRYIFILGLLVFPTASWAQGVLLPSSQTQSSQGTPNLGIAPVTTSPSAPSNNSNTNLPNLGIAPTTEPQSPTNILLQSTPSSTTASGKPSGVSPENSRITKLPNVNQASLKPGQLPTTIVHDPDPTPFLEHQQSKLPGSLVMTIGTRSFFDSNDTKTISKALGIAPNSVASSCGLTLLGMLKTDKSGFPFDGGISPQFVARYTGIITGYLMVAVANCVPPGGLAGNLGMVHELQGRYLVSLSTIACPPPTATPSKLTVTYHADKNSQCVYE